jgi:ABC-type multidrug transport system fused ATPase/permease subunit
VPGRAPGRFVGHDEVHLVAQAGPGPLGGSVDVPVGRGVVMSLLEVRNLRVEFPTRRATLVALDDVSFDIAPGEILGVVGESGAGKSLAGSAIISLLDTDRKSVV